MPTLTIDGVRRCPKCSKHIGKKGGEWPLLLCRGCIKWESNRPKHEQRMERRLQNGAGLSGMLHKYQATPAPRLEGPATLTLDDLDPATKNYLAAQSFTVEQLEALSKPWGHALYKQQVKAEVEGDPLRYARTESATRAAMDNGGELDNRLSEEEYSKYRSRRDSVLDPLRSRSASPRRSASRSRQPAYYESDVQELQSSATELWRRAISSPCLNCAQEQAAIRALDHALAHCPWLKQVLRRAVHYRLRQEGIEDGEDEVEQDESTKGWRAANSTVGGTGHRKEKHGQIRASFGNCAQSPCLSCLQRDLPSADLHCLLDCKDVRDKHLRRVQEGFLGAIAFVNELVTGISTSAATTPERAESTQTADMPSSVFLSTDGSDWRATVLNEILSMEMTARPQPALKVALAVQSELERQLMEEITTGPAEDGMPISVSLLELLKPHIETLISS